MYCIPLPQEKIPDPSVMNSEAMQSSFLPYQMLNSDNGFTFNGRILIPRSTPNSLKLFS